MNFDNLLMLVTSLTLFVFESYIQEVHADFCSRTHSRLAEEILLKVFNPLFESENVSPSSSCLIDPTKNKYKDNESHKNTNEGGRWKCEYCGKSFRSEYFIDNHFENRHSETVKEPPDGICLSDYCDILRCGVLNDLLKNSDKCNITEMDLLKEKCQKTVKNCVPNFYSGMKKYSFIVEMRIAVCDFLTCERYWEKPFSLPSYGWMFVIFLLTVSLLFTLVLFVLIYCTDTFTMDPRDEMGLSRQQKGNRLKEVRINFPRDYSEIRHRNRCEAHR